MCWRCRFGGGFSAHRLCGFVNGTGTEGVMIQREIRLLRSSDRNVRHPLCPRPGTAHARNGMDFWKLALAFRPGRLVVSQEGEGVPDEDANATN